MTSIDKILKFIELTHKLQKVERRVNVKNTNRRENDLEHQYQLSLLAWYIIDSNKLKLDKNKIIKYSLIHDVVEVYAGDTYFYGPRKNKKAREKKAANRLKKEFPEFKDLHRLIKDYESKKDKESKFVYALDKLIPIYNIYLDGGRRWHTDNITLSVLKEKKKDIVSINLETHRQFKEIMKILEKKEKSLFPKKN